MVTLPCQVEQVDCGHAWYGMAGTGTSQPMDDSSRVKEPLRSLLLWLGRSLEASRTAGIQSCTMQQKCPFCYTADHDHHPEQAPRPGNPRHRRQNAPTTPWEWFQPTGEPGTARSTGSHLLRSESPAKLLILGQWRPDLWVSDALALRPGLEAALPV